MDNYFMMYLWSKTFTVYFNNCYTLQTKLLFEFQKVVLCVSLLFYDVKFPQDYGSFFAELLKKIKGGDF